MEAILTRRGLVRSLVPMYADRGVMRAGGPRHAIRSSNVFVTELYCGRQPASVIRLPDSMRSHPVDCAGCRRGLREMGLD